VKKLLNKIKDFFSSLHENLHSKFSKEKTSEQLELDREKKQRRYEAFKEKQREREKKAEGKREIYRAKKLRKHEAFTKKQFEKVDKAEIREKSRTKDPTKQREVEILAQKKREELEVSLAQQKRVIESSTGRLSYERKKSLYGYGFISLWLIGVIFIFAVPLLSSIDYALSNTEVIDANRAEQIGTSPGIRTAFWELFNDVDVYEDFGGRPAWNNFYNFRYAFTVDPDFSVNLGETLVTLLPQVAMILVFSLFIALLLNQKFKGRTLMRAIFFFPVLIATGPVIAVINGSIMAQGAGGDAAQFSTMFQTDMVEEFLQFMGVHNAGENFTNFIQDATSGIFNLLWRSGIQILIFLSALQQIPTAAREAASMEGATAWEFFWKITFPTISPMILANLIYTIIDTFSDSQNAVMRQVLVQVQDMGNFGLASAFAWVYFGIIAVALAVVVAIVSRFVFYQVD